MHVHDIDHKPPLESSVHRAPAAIKLALALACVIFAIACPRASLWLLLLPAIFLLLAAALARLSPWFLFKRLLMLEPFVLGAGLMVLFQPGGGVLLAVLAARSTLGLFTMILLTATTPFGDILRVFRALRMPWLMVTTLMLMHRYIYVLSEESARMRRARASRTFTKSRARAWRAAGTVVAQLFLRASTRADRIYDAMRARGWGDGGSA